MGKYRVKSGCHIQGGKTYTQGQVVESRSELDRMFLNKFERLADGDETKTAVSTPVDRAEPASPEVSGQTQPAPGKPASDAQQFTRRRRALPGRPKLRKEPDEDEPAKFNVVNVSTGTRINDRPLTDAEANALVEVD